MIVQYKSPLKKLVKFFEKSRGNWKERSTDLQRKLIYCKNKINFLAKSKAKIKSENKTLKARISTLEKTLKKK